MRSFNQFAILCLVGCIVATSAGCGIVRGIEQWKCDRLGMCHFGIQPSAPPSYGPSGFSPNVHGPNVHGSSGCDQGSCNQNPAAIPPTMLMPPISPQFDPTLGPVDYPTF
jgi:hypothetical protein